MCEYLIVRTVWMGLNNFGCLVFFLFNSRSNRGHKKGANFYFIRFILERGEIGIYTSEIDKYSGKRFKKGDF